MKKIIILLFLALIFGVFLFLKPYYYFLTNILEISPSIILFSDYPIQTYDNKVNILLLGIAGGDNDGRNLSDSITVASYDFDANRLATISIPRDVWSATMQDKINSAYAYGELKEKGGGIKLAEAEVTGIVNLPIHYGAVIDFSKFKELIDVLGGVDINVRNSFTDNKFPISGKKNDLCKGDLTYSCRYKTVSFRKGLQHMNGEVALTFIRSRHSKGPEGSDFARTNRQQQMIQAIKTKLLKTLYAFDVNKLKKIYFSVDKLIERDINNQEIATILKNIFLKKNFRQDKIVLSKDFFIVPYKQDYQGKYVLIPKENSFELIYKYIDCRMRELENCDNLKRK